MLQGRPQVRARRGACVAIGCDGNAEPVSPNDLRRSYASWLKQRGADSAAVAKLLGHASTRMVDLVYGHLSDQTLARTVAMLPPSPAAPALRSAGVAEHSAPMRRRAPVGRMTSGVLRSETAGSVPRAGVEPATRGFSVRCSTN